MILSYNICAKDYLEFTGPSGNSKFKATWVDSNSFYGQNLENKLKPQITNLHFYGKPSGSVLVNLNTPMRAFFNNKSVNAFSAFI